MRTKTILIATSVLSLLTLGCDRQVPAPGAAVSSQDRQTAASAAEQVLEKSPPAAGAPSYGDTPGSQEGSSATAGPSDAGGS